VYEVTWCEPFRDVGHLSQWHGFGMFDFEREVLRAALGNCGCAAKHKSKREKPVCYKGCAAMMGMFHLRRTSFHDRKSCNLIPHLDEVWLEEMWIARC
jgi:hypothetical protein